MISESIVEEFLREAMELLQEDLDFDGPYTDEIKTFKEAGVSSSPYGLVIPFEDGSEFQVTVVRSKGVG